MPLRCFSLFTGRSAYNPSGYTQDRTAYNISLKNNASASVYNNVCRPIRMHLFPKLAAVT